jgi:hypothetical protein
MQEEAESAARALKKLKERQDAMAVVKDTSNMSASEYAIREERDKLLVSG